LRFSIDSKSHAAMQLSPKAQFPVGSGLLVPKKQAACPEFVPEIFMGNSFTPAMGTVFGCFLPGKTLAH
jgi:hypothetical protein